MAFARIQDAIDDIRAGRMVILTDDEDRENEGNLTMAADAVTPEAINFMATHGRGLICLALTEERDYCLADDIKRLVGPVCGHRVVVSSRYASRLHHGEEAEEILTEIVNSTRVPL